MIYHVAKTGNDSAQGTEKAPFLTINRAASLAIAGDTVIVHEGVYRECVRPVNGGTEDSRITYAVAEGEKAIIKGSETVSGWVRQDNIWHATVENSMFGEYNPYATAIDGDWMIKPTSPFRHTGTVYADGVALMEASNLDEVRENEMYWFADVKEDTTELYANLGSARADNSVMEINVRRSCFFPEKTGRNYITVRGFEIAQAATTWSPPTAEQVGAITVNWAKGWIIENNIIHDSRTCGISVGKPKGERDNFAYTNKLKAGYCCQLEVVMKASQKDWNKENIGSHIIRNNKIYDCGENGIVGHMGGAFSEFCHNEIYNIGTKHEYYGYEIAGIKLHAAIDAQIHHNHIHHCTMGTWLDWQAQGVHFHSNLYHHNTSDLWLEVTHGPFLADNNIFGSKQSLLNAGQGSAFVNNIFFGGFYTYDVLQRSTPYHFPHTTEIRACTLTYGGDERFYNNIFANTMGEETERYKLGTGFYNGSADSLEEYLRVVAEKYGRGDIEFYARERQPVFMANNYYGDGVSVYERDTTSVSTTLATGANIAEEDDGIYLEITLDEGFDSLKPEIITTEKLGTPRITECAFENPDGTPIKLDKDMLGASLPAVGAVAGLKPGKNKVLIWK